MIGNIDLHAWLSLQDRDGQTLVVPYLSSGRDTTVRYQIGLNTTGKAGTANISQSGTVALRARQPHAISTLRITRHADGQCSVRIVVEENGLEVGTYNLSCNNGG